MSTTQDLKAVSTAALVDELRSRCLEMHLVACPNTPGEKWFQSWQGNFWQVLGLIEEAKAKMLRPTLDEIL